ncbi:hypothetical protein L596_023923 [Steinernema carpocapsae]|uniref:Uncharacterized protein n=1 Tax=Steinernema carpocapsae TaxID=34508 RepID=A0A4U5MFV7_STECR|nr:hypothetical protein L596_023923 [Steinernema carpocapsae]
MQAPSRETIALRFVIFSRRFVSEPVFVNIPISVSIEANLVCGAVDLLLSVVLLMVARYYLQPFTSAPPPTRFV